MIKFKFTNLQENVLRFLFIHSGKSFNARRISKLLNVSQTAISKSLVLLKKEKLVLVEKDKNSRQLTISLNFENQKLIGMKRAENLRLVYESGLAEFLEDNFPGSAIILFGSYAYGNDYHDSDIDIAILNTKQKEIDLKKFEKLFTKEIRINFYTDWKDINKNLKENLLRGIFLSGGIEL